MTALGDTKRTSKVEVNGNYFYGEHFYFEKSNMVFNSINPASRTA
jgi:hypothetical protein